MASLNTKTITSFEPYPSTQRESTLSTSGTRKCGSIVAIQAPEGETEVQFQEFNSSGATASNIYVINENTTIGGNVDQEFIQNDFAIAKTYGKGSRVYLRAGSLFDVNARLYIDTANTMGYVTATSPANPYEVGIALESQVAVGELVLVEMK